MKSRTTFSLLVLLSLLTGLASCTSAATKEPTLDALTERYGGTAKLDKGNNAGAATNPQGKYLEIVLTSPKLEQRYPMLKIPASNCAYLVYKGLDDSQRKEYDFIKVTLVDSTARQDFNYTMTDLAMAQQAEGNLANFIDNVKRKDYKAAGATMNPVALGPMSPDSVPAQVAKVGSVINPINTYRLEGFEVMKMPGADELKHMVWYTVSIPHPAKVDRLDIVVNPDMSTKEQFLYGFSIADAGGFGPKSK